MAKRTRRKYTAKTKSDDRSEATDFRSELWAMADALETNDSAVQVLGEETLRDIA